MGALHIIGLWTNQIFRSLPRQTRHFQPLSWRSERRFNPLRSSAMRIDVSNPRLSALLWAANVSCSSRLRRFSWTGRLWRTHWRLNICSYRRPLIIHGDKCSHGKKKKWDSSGVLCTVAGGGMLYVPTGFQSRCLLLYMWLLPYKKPHLYLYSLPLSVSYAPLHLGSVLHSKWYQRPSVALPSLCLKKTEKKTERDKVYQ